MRPAMAAAHPSISSARVPQGSTAGLYAVPRDGESEGGDHGDGQERTLIPPSLCRARLTEGVFPAHIMRRDPTIAEAGGLTSPISSSRFRPLGLPRVRSIGANDDPPWS